MTVSPLTHPALEALPHGFFTRAGGVSHGIYRGLNCGTGSNDDPSHVAENRRRAIEGLSLKPANLYGLYQHHSADCLIVNAKSNPAARPNADAHVTDTPGVALSILTADCTPVLLADKNAQIIGAAHAGWKGASLGVLQNTVAAMAGLGAKPADITAVIGPTITVDAYEVGEDFIATVTAADPNTHAFINTCAEWAKPHFDLPGYAHHCLERAGVGAVHHTNPQCTYKHEDLFFSNRRRYHRDEADYGRLISIIALPPTAT
ncbi:MAG: peptidoglycan editing factor PgeF [Alphaproteobacteria bacterium]